MLKGALRELRVGDPRRLSVDIGPVITAEAATRIAGHVAAMRGRGFAVRSAAACRADTEAGTFVPPTLIEIGRIADVEREVFGPVLHVLRYRRADLDRLLAEIDATGYGLTFGLHSRIDETIARVLARVRAGNRYVNRNIIGAVVGVQPFGGSGLVGHGAEGRRPPRISVAWSGDRRRPPLDGLPADAAADPRVPAIGCGRRGAAPSRNRLAEAAASRLRRDRPRRPGRGAQPVRAAAPRPRRRRRARRKPGSCSSSGRSSAGATAP